jgi:hypothetical protein
MVFADMKPRKPREDGATALYQLRSADKEMLYVGISHRPTGRWREHAKQKPWWGDVAYRSLIWFDTRAEATIAEQATIEALGPRYNKTITPQDVPPPPGGGAHKPELHRLFLAYKAAYVALVDSVIANLEHGGDIDQIARSVDWTREYIAKIRKSPEAPAAAE